MQRYLVGGAVRDKLLGITVKDRDWVVTGTTPEQMQELGYQQVGADFPVFLHPETKEEHALARMERKSGRGYTGFICDFSPEVTLEEDLKRRDLTINAMALTENGEVFDPFGGQQDLQNRILRHVSNAFTEDPLRVLRVARFCARLDHLGFKIAPETRELIKDIANSGELQALTPERVWQETERALSEKSPWIYFILLKETKALAELFPELDRLFGIPQLNNENNIVDSGDHAVQCLKAASHLSTDPEVRFAALLHSLGCAAIPESEWPSRSDNINSGKSASIPVKNLCERLKTPKTTRELSVLAACHHKGVHRSLQVSSEEVVRLLDDCDVWRRPDRFSQFLLVCEAIARTSQMKSAEYRQVSFLSEAAVQCRAVNAKALVEKGYQGLELRSQLQQERTKVVKRIRSQWPD